jgi:hypothetical protein
MELTIQIFEITVEVTFPMPRSFAKDRLDNDALWLTDIAEGFAAANGRDFRIFGVFNIVEP